MKPVKPIVVNKYKDAMTLYIGRGSKWGNPFVIGKDGDRDEVIARYRDYIHNEPKLMGALHELSGEILGCYCKPQACHGDVLVELFIKKHMTGAGYT